MGTALLNYDIIIVGSGIVGATAALALAKNTSLAIAVIDAEATFPRWKSETYQSRVSAISLASQRIFQSLGVFHKIKNKRISPYTKMHVWEKEGAIHFDCSEVAELSLGAIIEDLVIRESLHETFKAFPSIHFMHPVQLISMEKTSEKVLLHAKDQGSFSAKLIVAADGAYSWVRDQTAIALNERDYGHTAIVTTAKTTLPHEKTAWQRFLPTGPLAFLPLDDPYFCSIVWSTLPEHAAELMRMNEVDFCRAMSDAFDYKLGPVMKIESRYDFPLRKRHATHYVEERVVLIGDAAHTVHPLVGQGVNLGLLDAVSLAEVIANALAKNRDFSSFATLRRYERWRKSDNAVMIAMVGLLKQLFSTEMKAVKSFRNKGLSLVDHLFPLKQQLIHYALGNRLGMPVLAQVKGE
jgi:2-polyprenylphenol 6-hydroxylase